MGIVGLRAASQEDSNVSSAKMVHNLPLTLPGELCCFPEYTSQKIVDRINSAATSFAPLTSQSPTLETWSVMD